MMNNLILQKPSKLLLIFFVTILLTSNGSYLAQNNRGIDYEWEKIIPLKTQMAEVEKLYEEIVIEGVSIKTNDYVKAYNSKQGIIQVVYNGSENGVTCKWNVTPDTVKSFSISLSKAIPISKIKFEMKNFEKSQGHLGNFRYSNEKLGVELATYLAEDGKEFVNFIYHNPTSCQRKTLCITEK